MLTSLLKLKNLIDIDEGRDLIISGSRKIQALLINSTPLFSKYILYTFWGGFFYDLGAKALYILDSIRSMAWWKYIENMKSEGLSHNFVINS